MLLCARHLSSLRQRLFNELKNCSLTNDLTERYVLVSTHWGNPGASNWFCFSVKQRVYVATVPNVHFWAALGI